MPILLLGHAVVPPTHSSVGVAISGTVNGRLVTGNGGTYLHETAQTIDNNSLGRIGLVDARVASTHAISGKVSLTSLTPSGIDPTGEYGRFRILNAILPSAPMAAFAFSIAGGSSILWKLPRRGGFLINFPL